ncbi:hypothetical protein N864_02190 [Intrasporangium chromatireducens Q5-1]|uniref:Right handed beta helix domain-containing protein n=1 Tax=Intrasporangium chromatireducens Q5-1 TaxID=584657 RepID=W9GKD4_9MICO|nr:right-handed parallel beta-helix repeat-containing protein [Intrasporangium chromatireducens]EWT05293.1 hypothetical protein N864_02190 [Intrasporangium chromatireducens Q5-1]
MLAAAALAVSFSGLTAFGLAQGFSDSGQSTAASSGPVGVAPTEGSPAVSEAPADLGTGSTDVAATHQQKARADRSKQRTTAGSAKSAPTDSNVGQRRPPAGDQHSSRGSAATATVATPTVAPTTQHQRTQAATVRNTAATDPTTTSSSATAAVGACQFKPSSANTGASGTRSNLGVTTVGAGQTLANANVGSLVITGANATIRNVAVNGNILVKADGAMIDHVTARGIAISSASNATVRYSNVGYTKGDGINVTSDRGVMSRNILFSHNFVHDPRVPAGAHYDGSQVRGVDGLTINCSTYDPGPYASQFNAGVYLEDANGGTSNVKVTNNWLYGFGFSVMMDARNVTLQGNRLGGDIHWGTCYIGKRVGTAGLTSLGNVWDSSGKSLALCK